ncbi:uncharacterized protein METZ01_LOCUS167775, partial [marine metagenome]
MWIVVQKSVTCSFLQLNPLFINTPISKGWFSKALPLQLLTTIRSRNRVDH